MSSLVITYPLCTLNQVFNLNCCAINDYAFQVKAIWGIITGFPKYYFLTFFESVTSSCVCWFGTTPSWKDYKTQTSAK